MAPNGQEFSPPLLQTHPHDSPSSLSNGSFVSPIYENQRNIPWEGPFLDHSPLTSNAQPNLEDPSSNFWRLSGQQGQPPNASFSGPSSAHLMSQQGNRAVFPYSSPLNSTNWATAPRSMSYGNVEGMHPNPPHPSQYLTRQELTHTPVSELYSPPSNTTRSASMASTSEPPPAPADGQPLHGLFGAQPMWNPNFVPNTMPGMTGKGVEGSHGWFHEPGQLNHVEDTRVSSGLGHQGAESYYSHAG
ncbi:MAG: hypothetical protein M4579_005619 [Chaenotheca gracillima]|nr:MAG: hypothetical protein M4579_005619 [Chaenotheca gracillima]